jgi:hypothetical protein
MRNIDLLSAVDPQRIKPAHVKNITKWELPLPPNVDFRTTGIIYDLLRPFAGKSGDQISIGGFYEDKPRPVTLIINTDEPLSRDQIITFLEKVKYQAQKNYSRLGHGTTSRTSTKPPASRSRRWFHVAWSSAALAVTLAAAGAYLSLTRDQSLAASTKPSKVLSHTVKKKLSKRSTAAVRPQRVPKNQKKIRPKPR